MAIEVLSPSYEGGSAEAVAYAPRRTFAKDEALHLVLIENGKPKAKQLLQFVGEEVQKRLPVATIETHSKPRPSASSARRIAGCGLAFSA